MTIVLRSNSWGGPGGAGQLAADADMKALFPFLHLAALRSAEDEPVEPPWQNEDRGWGVVVPARPGMSEDALRNLVDVHPVLKDVLTQRNGVVLRYVQDDMAAAVQLRDLRGGMSRDLDVAGGTVGQGHGEIPLYLMIVASPEEIPWAFQYTLQSKFRVGRLDLTDEGLANYCDALLNGFDDAGVGRRIAAWSVSEPGDITALIRARVAKPIVDGLRAAGHTVDFADGEIGTASVSDLESLLSGNPRLILTTSHGATPVGAPNLLDQLGRPVDDSHQVCHVPTDYAPRGAVWFAHACCSAGVNGDSRVRALVAGDTALLMDGLAALGSRTAPLPRELLGRPRPLRGFIGHVEPTFDWTLQHPKSNADLSQDLVAPFVEQLLKGRPLGGLLDRWHRGADTAKNALDQLREAFGKTGRKPPRQLPTFYRLMAEDRRSTVLLGDPAAVLA